LQLLQREGLDEVVVGAGVEAGDAVGHGIARGEHEHRRLVAVGAHAPETSRPSTTGIDTSRTIASNASLAIRSKAMRPSPATATP